MATITNFFPVVERLSQEKDATQKNKLSWTGLGLWSPRLALNGGESRLLTDGPLPTGRDEPLNLPEAAENRW